MDKLKYLRLQKGNEEHQQMFADLLTQYNREIAPEYADQSPEIAQSILDEMGPSGKHCEIVYLPEDGGIIGFSWGEIDSRGRGFLREFFVLPEYRRRGYGAQMVLNLERHFVRDGATDVWLTADAEAESFWARVGYEKTGEIFAPNGLPIFVKALMAIREIPESGADEKSRICRAILEALPDWFGIPESIDEYVKGVQAMPLWAAFWGDAPIGFIALTEHNPYSAEIEVMGILLAHQRSGLGKRLVEKAEQYSIKNGKSMLLVKTVDFAHPDIYYARTRAFYLALGFVPLQVLAGYWDEANPCLLLGKCLASDLKIAPLSKGDRRGAAKWAEAWDWGVGSIVAERLYKNGFSDWETPIVATVAGEWAGMCILEKRDDYGTDIDPALTPFITAVYVDPKFRGQRLGEKMLSFACNYARSRGFEAVYLISGEQGFYEKYGFQKVAQTKTASGGIEPVYKRALINTNPNP